MSWNYDTTLAANKDIVRFLIGDTDSNVELISDEEINGVLSFEANVYMAAAQVAEGIYMQLSQGGSLEDRKVGETRLKYKRVAGFNALANRLRTRGGAHMLPSSGGIHTADRNSYDANTALDKPNLAKGMMDNPKAGSGSKGLDSVDDNN